MATDWTPWKRRGESNDGPLVTLQGQVNRLVDDFFTPFGVFEPLRTLSATRSTSFVPRVDVVDGPNQMTVTAELPGMEEKDVELTLTREALTIRGEKRIEREVKDDEHGYLYERSIGAFQRVIPLQDQIAEDKVEAKFRNGVLTVQLPKSEETKSQSKKISINAG